MTMVSKRGGGCVSQLVFVISGRLGGVNGDLVTNVDCLSIGGSGIGHNLRRGSTGIGELFIEKTGWINRRSAGNDSNCITKPGMSSGGSPSTRNCSATRTGVTGSVGNI